jgi:adenine-specific DNA-methyltransferase
VTKPEGDIAKLDLRSEDVAEARRQELLRLFPEAHTESGGVNFEALRLSLGDAVQSGPEIFGMSWPGKAECAKTIQKQSIATLLPVEKESVNWDTTQNVIIEGDNLEVLKVLQKAYLGKVKMIYIDPPYNTGNDFIYPDNYTESLKTYLQYTGQVNDEGRKFSTNTDSSGRFHSKWMNMMYPRLSYARNLLREDGLIFISIDEREIVNLTGICDLVFGAENKVCCFTREAIRGGSVAKFLRVVHDYVLCYAKSISDVEFGSIENSALPLDKEDEQGPYRLGRELNKWGAGSRREDAPGMWFSIVGPSGGEVFPIRNDGSEGRWRLGRARMQALVDSKSIQYELRKDGTYICYEKIRDSKPSLKQYTSLLLGDYVNARGTEAVKEIFGTERSIFDYAKPVELLSTLISMACVDDGDIVLDFFAGSGTTGQAVLDENCKDGKNRRFILVQLPEQVTPESEAGKNGFETICDVTRERIRKVGQKFADGTEGNQWVSQDSGFRSFALDESNFAVWDADAIKGDETKLEQQLFAQVEHVLTGRTSQDILFELMLKSRYELTTPFEQVKVGKCEVWKVAGGEMVAIIDSGLTIEVIREVAGWKPTSVVTLDRCFGADDSLKANARKIFEDSKIDLKTV